MKVKKTLSLILACLMFSSFAAACNDNGNGSGEYSGTGPAANPGRPTISGGTGYGNSGVGGGASSGAGSMSGLEGIYGGSSTGGSVSGMEGNYSGGAFGSLGNLENGYAGGVSGGVGGMEGYYGSTSTGGSVGSMEGIYTPSGSGSGNVNGFEGSANLGGAGNVGDYEGSYSGPTGGGNGNLNDYQQSGNGYAGDVLTGGNGTLENDYTASQPGSTGSATDYENADGLGGSDKVNGNGSGGTGALKDYEAGVDNSYQGATTLVDTTWRSKQGYNYYYHSQLGDDVMPIGAWTAPPPAYGSFTTNQITLANYQTLAKSGINAIYGLYDKAVAPAYTDVLNALEYCDMVNNDTDSATGKIVYMVKDSSSYSALSLDGVAAIEKRKTYMSKPAYAGTLFVDEPGYVEFETIGEATKQWKLHDLFGETKLALVNNLPNYANASQLYNGAGVTGGQYSYDYHANYKKWVELYLEIVEPQVFSYDHYPFKVTQNYFDQGYYYNLGDVREACLAANVPFWIFAQVAASWSSNPRAFSYAEMALQVNTALAYGAKGIQWFNYWNPLEFPGDSVCAFVDHYGRPNEPYWTNGVKINKQVAAVDHVLMKSKSTGVIKIGNTPAPMRASSLISSYGALTSTSGSSGDAIVGCFEYRNQGWAYYIASNNVNAGATVKLTFNGSYNVEKIQNATSEKRNVSSVTVSVPAGEGVLIVVNK